MSDLDKTIEELEAEVRAELEEATTDAPKKGAAKGDSMEKIDGEVEDLGAPVTSPTDKGPDATKKIKKDTSDASKAGTAGDTTPEKVKEEADFEDRLSSLDVSEDVAALTLGEELSDEFKQKASTIFEAAIKSKLRSEVVRIETAKTHEVAEEVSKVRAELTEKVDAYMNYVVEEWMKENEIAIERGLKGEIAEDFISGLKSLFEEHYIDVPAEKYDILGKQSEQIDSLEAKLNEQIEKNAGLKVKNNELIRESVFAEVATDLAATEIEKFKSLAEDVDFTDEASFKVKLDTLKESYFPKAMTVAESVDVAIETGETHDTSRAMDAYLSAISKNVKRSK
jgi:hypothetical protein